MSSIQAAGMICLPSHAPPSATICPRRAISRAVAQMPPAHRGAPNRSTVMYALCCAPIGFQMYLLIRSANR
jgi:hypothetical protein